MLYKKISEKDFVEAERTYDDCLKKISKIPPSAKKKKIKITKGQYIALILSLLIVFYSIFAYDIPGFFFGMSFCIWMLHYFTVKFIPTQKESANSLLKSLSITIFFGSLLLLIL